MFIPGSNVGLAFAFVSLVCWGSWSNCFVQAERRKNSFRFELYYIDFTIAMPIVQLILCATLGQIEYDGDPSGSLSAGESVLTEEMPGNGKRILWALASGAVFNISNILLVNAITIAGMAVAFPLGIGTALVEGTVVTYIIDPSGDATLLFIGVALAFIAVCLVALTHWLKEKEHTDRLEEEPTLRSLDKGADAEDQQELLAGDGAAKPPKPSAGKTIGIALAAGVLMGLWNPAIVKAKEDAGPGGEGLSPYAALMWFQVAVFVTTFIYMIPLYKWPLTGAPPVAWSDYFNTGDFVAHALGWIGAAVWAIGTTANVVGGGSIGPAVSYALGQSAPAVACLWGLFVWREFDRTSIRVKAALASVFAFYAGAIACIAASK